MSLEPQDEGIIELERLKFPTVNYVQKSALAAPPLNIFAIALSLFMLSAPMMKWINYESPTLGTLVGIGGVVLYIAGFYDWYQNKTMASFMDFVFSLLHLTIYFTAYFSKYGIPVSHDYHSYLQGTFYGIYLAGVLFFIIGIKDKGALHLLSFTLYAVGLVLLILWEFSKRSTFRTISGYFIFVGSCFFWICGLGKLLSRVFGLPSFPGVSPTL